MRRVSRHFALLGCKIFCRLTCYKDPSRGVGILKKRILVTNDDGIFSDGLAALALASKKSATSA